QYDHLRPQPDKDARKWQAEIRGRDEATPDGEWRCALHRPHRRVLGGVHQGTGEGAACLRAGALNAPTAPKTAAAWTPSRSLRISLMVSSKTCFGQSLAIGG